MKDRNTTLQAMAELMDIIDTLREKCPWDRKQTFQSLRPLTLEETYELSDAILNNNLKEIKQELGDVLLHLVFYAKLGEEINAFTLEDAIRSLNEKLIYRHPHIYADTIAEDEQAVKENWEKLKLAKNQTSLLEGVPLSLSSLIKAYRLQEKTAAIGFDFPNTEDAWEKVKEEIYEYQNASTPQTQEEEFGDLIFSLVNYARLKGIDPDNALERTNAKFKRRFQTMEKMILEQGKNLEQLDTHQMDEYWNKVKSLEK